MADPSIYCTHIFGWNLMTRPDSTYIVKWCHFTMRDDHITVTINKHKADQGGKSDNKIKNIFANPSDPIQCPFLALFLLLITFTDISVFDGDNFLENEKVYNRWMKKVIDEMTEHEQIMQLIYNKISI